MKILWVFTLISFALIQHSHQISTVSDSHYTAGVVEFQPGINNLGAYLDIIKSDSALSTDIIVFPEATLNTIDTAPYVPDPAKHTIIPCLRNNDVYNDTLLVNLSCAARNTTKYVVVNVSEKEDCRTDDPRPCSATGYNIFNTNVVFDRNGAVVSRYRKVHLYGENRNTTYIPEYGYFDTDFGVRFGHFVCFDILFYQPAQEMADKYGIKDFIFTTMWFSQLPFLTAVQIQSSWSYANDVNLLSAGASDPIVGSSGTGIYNGRNGTLVAVMNKQSGERKLYIAKVPKKIQRPQRFKRELPIEVSKGYSTLSTDIIFLKRDRMETYHSTVLNLTKGNELVTDLCFDKYFCCHFELAWRNITSAVDTKYFTYRLGVLNGWRNEVAPETNFLKNCALFTCIGDEIADCGKTFAFNTTNIQPQFVFDKVLIEASFPKSPELLIMPNSLKETLLPVAANEFEFNVRTNITHLNARYMLNTSTADLMTFALYANYYDNKDGGASATTAFAALILLVVTFIRLF